MERRQNDRVRHLNVFECLNCTKQWFRTSDKSLRSTASCPYCLGTGNFIFVSYKGRQFQSKKKTNEIYINIIRSFDSLQHIQLWSEIDVESLALNHKSNDSTVVDIRMNYYSKKQSKEPLILVLKEDNH